jgi:DNA modification methylase
MSLKPHPLSQLLPMMSDAEYFSLRDSIDQHGQTDPVEIFEGKILDGRNRARAVEQLRTLGRNITLKTREFKGDYAAAVQLVYSRANHRNLSDSQKACAAANFLPHFEKLASSRHGGHNKNAPGGRATENAGNLFGVNRQYVYEARKLLESDAKLFQSVFDGSTTLSVARREIARRTKTKAHKEIIQRITPHTGEHDQWKIFTGDCIEMLAAMPAGKAKLVFADPPYNIGIDYGKGAKADQLSESEYLDWCEKWLSECNRILAKDGSLLVMIDGPHFPVIELMLRDGTNVIPAMHRRNVIIWHETFGTYQSGNFSNCWRPILYYTKSENFIWHGDQILIPSDRQTKYADARANAAGKVPSNVWDFPRLVDNAKERVPGFPTQIPQALVERIVLATTDPGDLVVDPFTGSGTTAAAAVTHHRKFAGAELSPRFAELARARVERAIAERKA